MVKKPMLEITQYKKYSINPKYDKKSRSELRLFTNAIGFCLLIATCIFFFFETGLEVCVLRVGCGVSCHSYTGFVTLVGYCSSLLLSGRAYGTLALFFTYKFSRICQRLLLAWSFLPNYRTDFINRTNLKLNLRT